MKSSFYVHQLDPFLINLEWFALPWYWLAYLAGFLVVWLLSRDLVQRNLSTLPLGDLRYYMAWGWFGLLLGSRLTYVFVYHFDYYRDNLWRIGAIWEGGMSFHGALLGAILSTSLVAQIRKQSAWTFLDLLACTVPLALGLGRISNFINGELVGRVSDVPWAVVFPGYDLMPRHPSQLYQAVAEGLVLAIIMWRYRAFLAKPGRLSSLFLLCYGAQRFVIEYWREPDPQLGFIVLGLSMGQLLSLLMLAAGILIYFLKRRLDSNR